ncbi:MAG: dihydroorotase family protein [Dehalococcoidia bacterium]
MPDSIDTLVRNARIVSPRGIVSGAIGIKGEKIAFIGSDEALPEAKTVIDAEGRYVIPGVVEPHTHLGTNPFRTFEENMQVETRAAASGGITSIFTMMMSPGSTGRRPRGSPPVASYKEVFDEAREIIDSQASIDVGLNFGILTDEQAREIPDYAAQCGVTAFKFFLSYTDPDLVTFVRGQPFPGMPKFDDGTVYLGMENIAKVGGVAAIHAEGWEIARVRKKMLMDSGRTDLEAWADMSPGFVEAMAIARMARLSQATGCRIYIVHVASREAMEEVRRAKGEGVDIVGETCPHYLTIDVDAPYPAALAKVSTPVRGKEHWGPLWEGLGDGTFDCVGSDHVVNPLAGRKPDANIWSIGMAFSECELALPLMLSEGVNRGRISLERLVEVCCENPARTFGVYPRKGIIQVGSDADLVILDMEKAKKVRNEELLHFSDFSIYEGMELKGWPVLTMLRGKVIVKDGQFQAEGRGQYLPTSGR